MFCGNAMKYIIIIVCMLFSLVIGADFTYFCKDALFMDYHFYSDKTPSLIIASLYKPETGDDNSAAEWRLKVWNRRVEPIQARILNMKPSAEADLFNIRLFVKPEGNFYIFYTTVDGKGAAIHYRFDPVHRHLDLMATHRTMTLEPWRITDGEDGFYDSVTCTFLLNDKYQSKCLCSVKMGDNQYCVYDSGMNEHFKLPLDQLYPVFNAYNCMKFIETKSKSITEGKQMGSSVYISNNVTLKEGDEGFCLEGARFHRQTQFYNLVWDKDKQHSHCNYRRTVYDTLFATYVPPSTTPAEVKENVTESIVIAKKNATCPLLDKNLVGVVAFGDLVLFFMCVVLVSLAVFGRRRKPRRHHGKSMVASISTIGTVDTARIDVRKPRKHSKRTGARKH